MANWRARMTVSRRPIAWMMATVLLIFGAFLMCGILAHNHRSRTRAQRSLNMYCVIGSLSCYYDVYKRLPLPVVTDATGAPLASWRMAVLPLSPAASTGPEDTQALNFRHFDLSQPWDAPENRTITGQPIFFYCFDHSPTDDPTATNVLGITGPGTAFDNSVSPCLPNFPPGTIVVIEVAGTGLPWAAPGDWDTTQIGALEGLIPTDDGFYVAFADQSVWHLRSDIPFETLSPFFFVGQSRERNRDVELGPYRID